MMIFLPLGDEAPQVAGMLGVADGRADLRELLDRVADLLIEDAPVGDHDHRIEHLAAVIGEPTNWCASQAMEFDLPDPAECWIRYAPPRALRPSVGQQLADDIELMEAREQSASRFILPVFGSRRSTIWA